MPKMDRITTLAFRVVVRARSVVPHYAEGAISMVDTDALLAAFEVNHIPMCMADKCRGCDCVPAILTARICGQFQLIACQRHPRSSRQFVKLHELAHVIMGDVDEPTVIQFTGPVPWTEYVCDMFAAVGTTTPDERDLPAVDMEALFHERYAIPHESWHSHRVPELARNIEAARALARPTVGKGGTW